MADLRSWSKELVIDLINQYKTYPCLWKVKSDEYRNKNLKEDAYKKLAAFCKGKGFIDANRDFIVKKIQSLRGSFRKELKKLVYSQRSGAGTDEIYTPTLWYFNYLLFTKDQELPTPSLENITVDERYTDNDFINENEETIQEINDESEQQNESLDEIVGNATSVANKKRKMSSNYQAEVFNGSDTSKSTKQFSESEIVGMNVAKKLEKMDSVQAIYAESIINNVLRRGLLKKLTENSDVSENNLTYETTSSSSLASTSKVLVPPPPPPPPTMSGKQLKLETSNE